MVFTIKIDARLAGVCAVYACIALFVVCIAFPSLREWAGDNSGNLASWVQAIGSILSIWAAWIIASNQKRESRDNDLKLAALDASTMYAELSSVVVLLEEILIVVLPILSFKHKYFNSDMPGVMSKILSISVRPLNEQEKLVLVGSEYLQKSSVILQEISNLKNSANLTFDVFRFMEDIGYDYLKLFQ